MFEVNVNRGNLVESRHKIKAIVISARDKIIYSTRNNKDLTYARSAVKVFQAIPLFLSGAADYYHLDTKQITISCSSHAGELQHIAVIKRWLKKIKISENTLKCGVHNPLNINISNKLLLSGKKPTPIYNNCSGKHLGMITTAIYKGYNVKTYLNLNHPVQRTILSILQKFTEHLVLKKQHAVDGCGVPQYAFPLESLALAMVKLSLHKKMDSSLALCLKKILESICKHPILIGGSQKFDSELIRITKGRIFCKIGAEGVLMFSDMKNHYGGILKVIDGNQRVIPTATVSLLKKIGSLKKNEEKKLTKWLTKILYNHAGKKIGAINCHSI